MFCSLIYARSSERYIPIKFKHLAIEKLYWPCAGKMATEQKFLQDSNCCSDNNVIRYCRYTYISSFVSIVFKVVRKL